MMDPATIAFIGLLLVSVTGNMAQFAMRTMSTPANTGESLSRIKGELSGDMVLVADAKVAVHAMNCPHMDSIMRKLELMDEKLSRHLEAHGR